MADKSVRPTRPGPNRLEQRGGASLPGVALFLGNFLYVVDVGSDLGDQVMQVVAEAEEGESFVEKFADARSTEQEQAEDYVVLAGVFDQFLGGGIEFGRSIHVGELVLIVEAHGHAEIVLTEEENVNAGNGGDLGDVLDAGGGFDLQGDDTFFIEISGVAKESGLVHAALGKINGARADGWILGAADGVAGLFGGIDIGNEDAVGAEIESLLDAGTVVVSADADDRLGAAAGDSAEHRRKFFVVHGAVLGIDEQPVVAAVRELLGDRGTVRVEEQADLWRALMQLLFEFGTAQSRFGHAKSLRKSKVELCSVTQRSDEDGGCVSEFIVKV